ncbi:MAG TPA: trypsin-like peptidase domain-containing protein [Actinomycetota bacterium]|nr:trypsin-like peptidase domain-containing protein [Actinomycetota bacterium]
MQALREIQESVRDVTETVGRAVVGIGDRWAIGSGVVFEAGKVVTNAHNIRASEVAVSFHDGRSAVGRVTGTDIEGDVAVVEVDTADIEPVAWADDQRPGVGTPVFALSNPGGRGLRVTFGLVSGTDRSFRGPRGHRISGSLEHTAPLLPGSSGGPVVDLDHRLIGINTNRLGEGFYLAIPADDTLRSRIGALGRGDTPRRPRLGVGIAPAEVARRLRRAVGLDEVDGLLVREVEEGSPAAAAGLEQGDLIVEAGGRATGSFDDLHDALRAAEGSVELKLMRGAEVRTVTVTLA